VLWQKSPLNGDITRGLLGWSYSGQALEFIRPEATVFVFRHALACASGIMSLGRGVGGKGAGEKEDKSNKECGMLKPSQAGLRYHNASGLQSCYEV
jgi:hypothetical protein